MSTLCTFSSLTAPFLMAYNTTDHVYYLKQHSEIKDELTEQQLASFLQDVLEGRAKVMSSDLWPGDDSQKILPQRNRIIINYFY